MKTTVIIDKTGKVVGSMQGLLSSPEAINPKHISTEDAGLVEGDDYLILATPALTAGIVKEDDYNYIEIDVPEDFAKFEAIELHEKLQVLVNKNTKHK